MHKGNEIGQIHCKGNISVDISQVVAISTASRPKPARTKARVSNGRLLPISDERSKTFRRYRDLYEAVVADLGGDDILRDSFKRQRRGEGRPPTVPDCRA
jgi:hypothetical protein